MLTLLAFLAACEPDGADSAQTESVQEDANEEPADVVPALAVNYPERASFVNTGSGTVFGKVERGTAAITEVSVNGQAALVAQDGSFALEMPWASGIQLLGIRAEDESGQRAVDGRSVYAGPVHAPGDWLPGVVRFEIDSDILDDDDEIPDDIASLLEIALEDPSLAELAVGQSFETMGLELTPTNLTFEDARVDLAAGEDLLEAEVRLNQLTVDFEVNGTGILFWFSTTGSAYIEAADLGADLSITSSAGRIRTEPLWLETELIGYELQLDWFPDSLEDDLANWTEELLEDTVTEMTAEVLREQVNNALNALVVDLALADGFDLAVSLSDIALVPDAVRLVVDARLDSVSNFALPEGAGSLLTAGEPPQWPLSNGARVGVAVDDDFLNLLGFAMWQSGMLRDVEIPGVVLSALAGDALPPPLGPAESVEMALELPPVVKPPKDGERFDADVSVGEWRIKFNREDGQVLDFSINLRSGLQAEVLDGTELVVHLDNRPAFIDLEVGVIEWPEALDPGDLAALIRLIIPPLIGNSAEIAPAIPIPTIPLQNLVDLDVVEDMELVISQPQMSFSEEGWLQLQADLEVQ